MRELENVVERLAVVKSHGRIELSDLSHKIVGHSPESLAARKNTGSEQKNEFDIPDAGLSFKDAVEQFESKLIVGALKRTGSNKNKAAALLKLNRTTLVEKIKKKKLEVEL